MFSPLDIEHKDFGRSLFGYNQQQVKTFLESLAKQTEELIRENKRLTKELDNKGTLIEELQTGELELKRTVVAAERIGNEMKNNAEREAHLILKEAEQQKDITLREAKLRHKELTAEISRLEKEYDLFREQFRGMLRAFERGLDATSKLTTSHLATSQPKLAKARDSNHSDQGKPEPVKQALANQSTMKKPGIKKPSLKRAAAKPDPKPNAKASATGSVK